MVFDTSSEVLVYLIGRTLFAAAVIGSAVYHLRQEDRYTEYAHSRFIPHPQAAVYVANALLLAGGLSVLTGIAMRWGAILLMVYYLLATQFVHNFWDLTETEERQREIVNYLKNMTILGACFILAAIAGGDVLTVFVS